MSVWLDTIDCLYMHYGDSESFEYEDVGEVYGILVRESFDKT